MYAKNIATFLKYLVKEGQLDARTATTKSSRETLVTHAGEVVHPRVREAAWETRCKQSIVSQT